MMQQQQQAAQSFVLPAAPETPVLRYPLSGWAGVWQVWGTSQAPRGWQAELGCRQEGRSSYDITADPTHCLLRPRDDKLNQHARPRGDSILASSRITSLLDELPITCRLTTRSPASRPRLGLSSQL